MTAGLTTCPTAETDDTLRPSMSNVRLADLGLVLRQEGLEPKVAESARIWVDSELGYRHA